MTGLTSIEVNGEPVGLKFGLESNRIFFEGIADHLLEVNQGVLTHKDIGLLIYSGYINFCTVNDLIPEAKYSLGKLTGWAEDNMEEPEFNTEITRVALVFKESKHTISTAKKIVANIENEIKKKTILTGILSNPIATGNLESEAIGNMPA